jgi:hypothetical protein
VTADFFLVCKSAAKRTSDFTRRFREGQLYF